MAAHCLPTQQAMPALPITCTGFVKAQVAALGEIARGGSGNIGGEGGKCDAASTILSMFGTAPTLR